MLDMFQTDQQNQMNEASRTPIPTLGTTPAESFGAALDASERNSSAYSQSFNEADFIRQKLDEFQSKTGQKLDNPGLRSPVNPLNNFVYDRRIQALRDKFADTAQQTGDSSIAFPSDDEIKQGGVNLARQSLLRQEALAQGQQNFGAGVAGFVGGQIVSLPSNAAAIATIPEGGLAAKMLGAAAGFGGVQLFNDLTTFGYRKAVNPEFGAADIAKDVAYQAAGGAAFELGGAAIGGLAGAIWRRFKNVAPAVADKVPLETQDTGNVAERVADLYAQNPFKGAAGEAAHTEAIAKIESDLQAGRPPELPPSAGDPSIAVGPTDAEIGSHAAATNPELYARVDQLQGQIAEARANLDAKLNDPNFRLLDKNIPVENELRVQLNDLQQQRAALGPEVNATRQAAEDFLRSHPETTPGEVPPTDLAPAAPKQEPVGPVNAAQAFGDKATVDAAAAHPYKGINRISEAMEDAAPAWKAMRDAAQRGDIPPAFDVTEHIMSAVRALVRAKDEGRTIADVMNNGPEFHSDTSQMATRLFFKPDSAQFLSKSQISENLKFLADGLRETPKEKGAAAPSPRVALPPQTSRLVGDATAPEAIEKVANDPKVHEAMGADLQRNIEQGRNRVPVDDGQGGVRLGVADAELKAIDDQISAAQEISACATPVAEAAE
jgi:hypothetical protein